VLAPDRPRPGRFDAADARGLDAPAAQFLAAPAPGAPRTPGR